MMISRVSRKKAMNVRKITLQLSKKWKKIKEEKKKKRETDEKEFKDLDELKEKLK